MKSNFNLPMDELNSILSNDVLDNIPVDHNFLPNRQLVTLKSDDCLIIELT